MLELLVGIIILLIVLAIVWYAGGVLGLPQPVLVILLLVVLLLGVIILVGSVDLDTEAAVLRL